MIIEINANKQTVCFLWFESLPTLHSAASQMFPHPKVLDIDSIARPEFIRWTKEVLSTTQVSTNVVILAMLFIYRLKLANPTVKGRAGSEYRLLTVALMLGNKFLDDNTYTNKTWAEVTNIPVKEIHLMEVEFLSNVRYQLMVTLDEWSQWLQKINMFVMYQQKQIASRCTAHLSLPSPPMLYDAFIPMAPINGYRYTTNYMHPVQQESRGRKRSLGDPVADYHNMLPPYKRMLSQPSTPRKNGQLLRPRAGEMSERSPVRRRVRAIPSQCAQSHCSLSPSLLQIGTFQSTTSSPDSSLSQISAHSHGAGYGYSPTSLALQHRASPYAPVQPVHRLIGNYKPQTTLQRKQQLWYQQVAAGQSLYRQQHY